MVFPANSLFGGRDAPPASVALAPSPVAESVTAPGLAPSLSPFGRQPTLAEAGHVGLRLTAEDRALMNAIAAQNLRYGQVEEALAILQMVNRLWPDDAQTLRLLTQCFVALEDWPAAEATFDAHERVAGEASFESGDFLRRAVILLKRYGLNPALGAFQRFMDKVAQGFRS